MGLDLRINVVREPGKATVTGEVLRDGERVPIDWPVIIIGREGHLTDEAVREAIEHLAAGL